MPFGSPEIFIRKKFKSTHLSLDTIFQWVYLGAQAFTTANGGLT
jgi:hypothetical protein